MSRREQAKESRRTSIVNAARRLIHETGETGFQMRALADAAGLSLVTPYNLFGSKQAIMIALLESDVREYEQSVMRLRGDELDRFFNAVTLTRRLYSREPNFHRIVMAAAYQDGGREFRSTFRAPRRAFWQRMVANAVHAGQLQATVPIEPFASTLAYTFLSAIMEWVAGEISLEEMEARAHYGFALLLLPMAAPATVPRVQRKLAQYTAAVKKWDRRLPDTQPLEKTPPERRIARDKRAAPPPPPKASKRKAATKASTAQRGERP